LLAEYLIRSAPAFWFGNIQVIMNGLTDAQRTTINSLDIGSQVSVTKSFPNSTPSTVTQLMALEGISHDITPDRHIVTLYPNPARIYTYFIVGGYPVVVTRTNLVNNPNFETNVTGWSVDAPITFVRSTADFYVGTASALATITNSTEAVGINNFDGRNPASAGLSYTLSGYFKLNSGTAFPYYVALFFFDAANNVLSSPQSTTTTIGSAWERKSVTATAPANTATVALGIIRTTALPAGTCSFYCDAIMIEQAASSLPYFDGTYVDNYTGYGLNSKTWNGTADASTSTATWYQGATRTNLMQNPNFETNALFWEGIQTSGTTTVARITTDDYIGTACLEVTKGTGRAETLEETASSSVTPGNTYTISGYMKVPAGNETMTAGARCLFLTNAGALVGSFFTGTTASLTSSSGWVRFSVTAVAPATAQIVRAYFGQTSGATAGQKFLVDAVLVEQASSALPYFDGTYADTYTGYTLTSQGWSGTADASTSTATWGLTSSFVGSELDDDTKGLG
jgi:hypothetical protein